MAQCLATSATLGSPQLFNSGSTDDIDLAFNTAVSGQFVLAFEDDSNSSYGTAMTGTISGNTITYAPKYVYYGGSSSKNEIAYDPTSGKFVISNIDYGLGAARVATVTGTAITFGTEVFWTQHVIEKPSLSMFSTHSKFVIAYKDNNNANASTAIVGTISGTSLTFSSEYNLGTAADYNSVAVDPNGSGKFIVAIRDENNGQLGTLISGQIGLPAAVTNLTADNFIGMSSAAYADGDTSSIVLVGGVTSNHTGLTTNAVYYVQTDGTIATTADTPSVEAGRALSTTSLLLTSEAGATGATGAAGASRCNRCRWCSRSRWCRCSSRFYDAFPQCNTRCYKCININLYIQ